MATNAYLTYHDGKLEVPEELQREMQLEDGARLRIVYTSADQIVLRADKTDGVNPAREWHFLRGVLSNAGRDLNAELDAERIRENELDARWG